MYKSIANAVVKDAWFCDMDGAKDAVDADNVEETGVGSWRVDDGDDVGEVGDGALVDPKGDKCKGCLKVHLFRFISMSCTKEQNTTDFAQLPDSPPRPAPIHGWPTPKRPPLHTISNGSFTPR